MTLCNVRKALASAVSALFLTGQAAFADVNADANALFVRAVQAWDMALALAADDPATAEQRRVLIAQANADLDRILSDLPGSDLAVKVVVGETVGSFDIAAVRAALGESDPVAPTCANAPTPACLIDAALADMAMLDRSVPPGLELYLVIDAMSVADDTERAIDLLKSYPDIYMVPFLTSVLPAMAEAGQAEAAAALIAAETDPADRSFLTAQLALGLAQAGQVEQALAIVGQSSDPRDIIPVLAAADQYDEAAALIARVPDDSQDHARHAIATVAAQAGDIAVAQDMADLIVDVDLVHNATVQIAIAQARAGLSADALASIDGLAFGHLELILQLSHAAPAPDDAYVAAFRNRFVADDLSWNMRRDVVLGLSILDPSPEVFAALADLSAGLGEDDLRRTIHSDTLLLSFAGLYDEAAALTLNQRPGALDPSERIENLTFVARAMAADPKFP